MKIDKKWRQNLTTDQIVKVVPGFSWVDAFDAYKSNDQKRAILFAPGTHSFSRNEWVSHFDGWRATEERPFIVGHFDPAQRPIITRNLGYESSPEWQERNGRALFNVVAPCVAITGINTLNTGPVAHFQTFHHNLSDMTIGLSFGMDTVSLHDQLHFGGVDIHNIFFGESTNWIRDGVEYQGGAHKIYPMLPAGKQQYPIEIYDVSARDGTGYLVQASGCKVTMRRCGAVNTRGFVSVRNGGELEVHDSVYVRDAVPSAKLLPKFSGESHLLSGLGSKLKSVNSDYYLQAASAIGPVHGLLMNFQGNKWFVKYGVRATWDDLRSGVSAIHDFESSLNALSLDDVDLGTMDTKLARERALGFFLGESQPEPEPEPEPKPDISVRLDEILAELSKVNSNIDKLKKNYYLLKYVSNDVNGDA